MSYRVKLGIAYSALTTQSLCTNLYIVQFFLVWVYTYKYVQMESFVHMHLPKRRRLHKSLGISVCTVEVYFQ